MTAEAALARLGVRAQTLYAYASRGRVEVRPDPADPRRSLYRAADVEALRERQRRSRRRAEVAAGAIAWGEPVLDSALTSIDGGRLFYRGVDVETLAEREPLEAVARRLWGVEPAGSGLFPAADLSTPAGGVSALFPLLAGRVAQAVADGGEPDRTGAESLAGDVLATVAGGPAGAAHRRLAAAWGAGPGAADPIRRALVLAADHELNPSAFAARLAASTGAGLAAAVLAGLSTLTGPSHGGVTPDTGRLFAMAGETGPEHALDRWRERRPGCPAPGFGHRLYPYGDVRARLLLDAFDPPPPVARLRELGERQAEAPANFDFALHALAATFGLPPQAPLALFAVARTCGWIAHALEQTAAGRLIRPRARYVGPPLVRRAPALEEHIVLGGHWD